MTPNPRPALDGVALFRMPLRSTPATASSEAACPLCGKPWRPWAGSYLPAHARCLWTRAGLDAIVRSPLSAAKIAAAVGIPKNIIYAGVRYGLAARARTTGGRDG